MANKITPDDENTFTIDLSTQQPPIVWEGLNEHQMEQVRQIVREEILKVFNAIPDPEPGTAGLNREWFVSLAQKAWGIDADTGRG